MNDTEKSYHFTDVLDALNTLIQERGKNVTSLLIGISREAGATNITLYRTTEDASWDGIFDNANFDSTSFNRGWIIIDYVD